MGTSMGAREAVQLGQSCGSVCSASSCQTLNAASLDNEQDSKELRNEGELNLPDRSEISCWVTKFCFKDSKSTAGNQARNNLLRPNAAVLLAVPAVLFCRGIKQQ